MAPPFLSTAAGKVEPEALEGGPPGVDAVPAVLAPATRDQHEDAPARGDLGGVVLSLLETHIRLLGGTSLCTRALREQEEHDHFSAEVGRGVDPTEVLESSGRAQQAEQLAAGQAGFRRRGRLGRAPRRLRVLPGNRRPACRGLRRPPLGNPRSIRP